MKKERKNGKPFLLKNALIAANVLIVDRTYEYIYSVYAYNICIMHGATVTS